MKSVRQPSARSASTRRSSARNRASSVSPVERSARRARSGISNTRGSISSPRAISQRDTICTRASRSRTPRLLRICPRCSRTISFANSSRTSSATARSSDPSTPEPSSRSRKSARPPKRQPAGAPDEPLRARCSDPPPAALLRGIEQFNAGEFFEQHETLELLWRDTAAPVRHLYHGILQVGVGFHHWRRGNFHGASVLLEEGIERLRPFAPTCQTIDVAALIADAAAAREQLIALGPDRMSEFDLANASRVRFAR